MNVVTTDQEKIWVEIPTLNLLAFLALLLVLDSRYRSEIELFLKNNSQKSLPLRRENSKSRVVSRG